MIPNQNLLENLKLVFGPLFDEIVARAEQMPLTLDERIEAYRQWPSNEFSDGLEEMERMQRERDTRDYSEPGTWYGCIRKWQAMTDAEALASFRTDWNETNTKWTQEELKAFYTFLQKHPLPDLTPEEETEMYDRRNRPACLTGLFKAMSEAGLTPLFEDTYDYNYSEPWTIDRQDYRRIRDAFDGIRGDALETFLLVASEVLEEKKWEKFDGWLHTLDDEKFELVGELLKADPRPVDFQGVQDWLDGLPNDEFEALVVEFARGNKEFRRWVLEHCTAEPDTSAIEAENASQQAHPAAERKEA